MRARFQNLTIKIYEIYGNIPATLKIFILNATKIGFKRFV